MRHRPRTRLALAAVSLALLVPPGCGRSRPANTDAPDVTTGPTSRFPDPTEKVKPQTDLLKNEVPPDQFDAVVRAHFQGLGHMERYEYAEASAAFREVHERAPGWIPGSINLAIALLNDTGTKTEEAGKKGGGAPGPGSANFAEALALLDGVLTRDPDNLHARYCRGLIFETLGAENTPKAHEDFKFVADHDPSDAHAWYKVGSTLSSAADPSQPAGPEEADKLVELYSRALDRNPYLVTALFKLQQACSWANKREKQKDVLDRWRRLNLATNPTGAGDMDMTKTFYGGFGKYGAVINPFGTETGPTVSSAPPKFDQPARVKVALGEGERWVRSADLSGPFAVFGRARARFGATVVVFDADGDGRADLFLAASVKTAKGVRDALLLNKEDGRFEDVSTAWGLDTARPSLGAAAADFDADRRPDLFLCGPSGYTLLRNRDGKKFDDVSEKAGLSRARSLGLTARWLDLDHDGDLDLYVVNYTDLEHAADAFGEKDVPGAVNAAFRNDGRPAPVRPRPETNWAPLAVATEELPAREGLSLALTPWPDAEGLLGPAARHVGIAALDADDDRDVDLALAAEGEPLRLSLNDRLGVFHGEAVDATKMGPGVSGLLVADFDKDGRADLAATDATGPVAVWTNSTKRNQFPVKVMLGSWPTDAKGWRAAVASDVDLDTSVDLVGLPASPEGPVLGWARNEGKRLAAGPLPVGPADDEAKPLTGFALADVVGDALPDAVLIADGAAPAVARNLGNGNHWLALDLAGRWKYDPNYGHMRTNPHGLGTRLSLEGQGLLVNYDHTTPASALGQSLGPVVLGLGRSPSVELIRLRWPDGAIQCELNQKADVTRKLTEVNRKLGSCPVLFTWNGSRFVCLGDFLGGGGLGYLVAPGVYGQPDRDESVSIAADQLAAVDGVFRLSVTEPMDEVAYLDRLILVAVDRPPGVSATPDERFAPEGTRPTGEVIAWWESVEPVTATDLKGRDVSAKLRAWDRDTVDDFRRLDGWVGYAEEHGIVLDFGDRLRAFGPADPLVLVLAGWVEYPYSQTNYAAATAGVVLDPPCVERRNDDGTWSVIEPHAGYPAGLPRMTTLDLTGKLTGPRCVIRLRTNMECYWDQAFLAVRDRRAEASLRQTTLPAPRGVLGHRGYTRESSPDGRLPLLYDYDHIDPAPLAMMSGRLTRFGDVSALLAADDDRLCLVGPGDEVRLEFDARSLPDLPPGWTRSYVLRAVGYCKDADPFTAGSDRVEPLPWRGMPAYPFPADVRRPDDPGYRDHLGRDQTRPAGGP